MGTFRRVSRFAMYVYFVGFSVMGSTSWGGLVHSMQNGSVANFFMDTPARIEQYDLTAKQWLPSISLLSTNGTLTAGWIDADGIYAAYGTTACRYNLNGGGEVHLFDAAQNISQIFSDENILFLNRSGSLYARFTSIDKGSNTVIENFQNYIDALVGASIAPSSNRMFGRSAGISPADITYVNYNADGSFVGGGDSPQHGGYPSATKTWVFPQEELVIDNAGSVFKTADLRFSTSIDSGITDIVFRPNGSLVVLRSDQVTAYTPSLLPTAATGLDYSPNRIFMSADDLVSFTAEALDPRGIEMRSIPLAELNPIAPGEPVNPVPAMNSVDVNAVPVLSWQEEGSVTNSLKSDARFNVYLGTDPTDLHLATNGLAETTFNPGKLATDTSFFWRVDASNATGVATGAVWQFTTWAFGELDHFAWAPIGTPQCFSIPFGVELSAKDLNGDTVVDFMEEVALSGFDGSKSGNESMLRGVAHDNAASSSALVRGLRFSVNDDITLTHLAHYWGTEVSLWTDAGEQLLLAPVTNAPGAWSETELTEPILLTAGSIYRVASHGIGTIYRNYDNTPRAFSNGTIIASCYGSGFPSSTYTSYTELVDFRYFVGQRDPLVLTPTNTADFASGVWTGMVTVAGYAEKAFLKASTTHGVIGDSEFFKVDYLGYLSVELPEDVNEDAGVLSGGARLTVSPIQSSDVIVNLSVNEGGDLAVPAQVTLPAGQASVVFDLAILDDTLLDGTATSTVHAVSFGYGEDLAALPIHDNETTRLFLSLPQTTFEGAGVINGALQLGAAPDRDVAVELLSNQPSKIGSSSVLVPAGQTFVAFSLPVYDNAEIDGIQTATIEARVRNWTPAQASVFVFDNETTGIDLQLPASVWEGDTATNSGTITLSGSSPVDVQVLLTGSDSSELMVPNYVTVPAGQTSISFEVEIPDDSERDGTQSVSVFAEAPGYVPSIRYVNVKDNDLFGFEVTMSGPEIDVLAPASVDIVAKNIDGLTLPNIAVSLNFSAFGERGDVPVEPSVTTNLMSGVLSEIIALGKVDDNVVLVVDDGAGHSGTGSLFSVIGSVIALEPAALTNITVVAGETITRTLVISNAGNADLEFSIDVPVTAPPTPPVSSVNLVANGDFEEGNTGFASDYVYTPLVSSTTRGIYSVDDDSKIWDASFTTSVKDYTSGTGQMLMGNGSSTANTAVWQQEVSVVSGETYQFSAWTAGLLDQSQPTLEFRVNGISVGSISTENITWKEFSAQWTATSSGTVILSIVDTLSLPPFIPDGNVFAIDDISFMKEGGSVMPDAGLIAHFPFNGNASDESGKGNDGIVNGATLTTDRFGNADSAYHFDGIDDRVVIPDGDAFTVSSMTVAAWVKTSDKTDFKHFISCYGTGYDSEWYNLYLTSGTGLARWAADPGGNVTIPVAIGSTDLADDAWHFVVGTRNTTTSQLKVYVDGVLEATVSDITTESLDPEVDLWIGGQNGWPSRYFTGDIDDVRVYNRALSAEEVTELANVVTLDPEVELDAGLIAHFPFNGNAVDESGNGHDGTVNGATLTADRFGNPDAAYDFNGSSAFINCGNIINGFSNFTVSAWVNIDRFTASDYMGPWSQQRFSYSVENGNYTFYTATHSSSGFGTSMRWDDGVGLNSRVGHTLPLNEWHLITQTYDGNEVRQYDNDNLVNTTVAGAHTLSNSWDFLIGKAAGYPGYLSTKYFDGQIDELRIYDRALSEEEIIVFYNEEDSATSNDPTSDLIANFPFSGNADDESGNGHVGTVNGATLTEDRFGNVDSAYAFDGLNDYIRIGATPDVPALDAYTISVWFLNDGGGDQNGNYGQKILDRTSFYHDFYLTLTKTGAPRFFLYEGSAGGLTDASRDYRDSKWHHMVVTRDGETALMWLDGAQVAAATNAFSVYSTSDLLIGYSDSGDSLQRKYWSGKIDDLGIYDRALSAEEITALYSGDIPGSGSGGTTNSESWLTLSTAFGTIPPGSNMVVAATFNALGMVAGDYSDAMLTVVCNDALSLSNAVPVSMWVLPTAPLMLAEPEQTEGVANEVFWNAIEGPVSYWVEVASSTNTAPLQDSDWIAATNHLFQGLEADTVYHYRVKASVESSIGRLEGPWSNWVWSEQISARVDGDGNGIPDWWEVEFFGQSGTDAQLDADGDGQSNYDEFIAGVNPTNANSLFKVDSVNAATGAFVISWKAVTGRVYSIHWKNGMTNRFQSLETGIRHPQNSYTDTVHSAEDCGFYLIDVGLDDAPVPELY